MNGGATLEQVRAVREVVIKMCESAGMIKLGNPVVDGWGWRLLGEDREIIRALMQPCGKPRDQSAYRNIQRLERRSPFAVRQISFSTITPPRGSQRPYFMEGSSVSSRMPQMFNPGCSLIHGRLASAKSISDHSINHIIQYSVQSWSWITCWAT